MKKWKVKKRFAVTAMIVSWLLTLAPISATAATITTPWATTCTSDNTYCLLNNAYNLPSGGTMSGYLDSSTSWGGSYNFNGGSGGVGAGQLNHGKWPWGASTSNTKLPFKVNDPNRDAYAYWKFTNTASNSPSWQMYWELWGHTSAAIEPSTIAFDLMILPDYERTVASITADSAYQGSMTDMYGYQWHVIKINFTSTAPLILYYRAVKSKDLTVRFDDFWNHSVSKGWINPDHYVGSVTAGMEAYSGSGSFATHNYLLNIY